MTIELSLHKVKYGLTFGLITLLFGFFLGMYFGLSEEAIKTGFITDAMTVKTTVYNDDLSKITSAGDKAWKYYKRAHVHANGLGTIAIVLSLLLALLSINQKIKLLASTSIGLGSLLYSFFWFWAGMRIPSLGSSDLAKESLRWLAFAGTTLCIVGLVTTFIFTILSLFKNK